MVRTTQKEIRRFGNEELFWERLKKYQKDNNTSGVPCASELGLKCIAYSVGVYGCNGTAYVDENGTIIGVPTRSYNSYVR